MIKNKVVQHMDDLETQRDRMGEWMVRFASTPMPNEVWEWFVENDLEDEFFNILEKYYSERY